MPGLGAFGFQLQEVPGNKRIITTTRSHSNKVVIDCVDAMEPHEVIRVGGAGNKVRCIKLWRELESCLCPVTSLNKYYWNVLYWPSDSRWIDGTFYQRPCTHLGCV